MTINTKIIKRIFQVIGVVFLLLLAFLFMPILDIFITILLSLTINFLLLAGMMFLIAVSIVLFRLSLMMLKNKFSLQDMKNLNPLKLNRLSKMKNSKTN